MQRRATGIAALFTAALAATIPRLPVVAQAQAAAPNRSRDRGTGIPTSGLVPADRLHAGVAPLRMLLK